MGYSDVNRIEAIRTLLSAADAGIGDASTQSVIPIAIILICLFFLFFIIKTFQLNSFYEFITNLLHHDIDYSLHILLCQPIPDISYIFL